MSAHGSADDVAVSGDDMAILTMLVTAALIILPVK